MSEYLDQPKRSLVQYAEELREQIDQLEVSPSRRLWDAVQLRDIKRRLLDVEREINWRMGI